MTVANDYSEIVVQSTATSIDIPITWDYGNTLTNLFILQQDLVSGASRDSSEGGFTFTKTPDGTSITVAQYSVFAGNNTEYTVSRNIPLTQDYNLTEESQLDAAALEAALDDQVRMMQDLNESADGNSITSVNPYEITDKVNRAGHVLGYDAISGEPVYIGDVADIADISAAVQSCEDDAAAAASSASAASVSETNAAASAVAAAASAALIPLFKDDATVDPTATDDSGSGYAVNSLWTNVTTDKSFICVDATLTAAVWNEVTAPLNNFVATTAPGTGDDSGDGYEVGSIWIDVTADKSYICVDATAAAAVWNEQISEAGGATTIQVFTSGGTYTTPTSPAPTQVLVTLVGAAGGGGGGYATGSNSGGGGGGGGGGGAKKYILHASLGVTETVTIGSGGSGGAAGANDGSAGGSTSFGAHCSSTGGGGGLHGEDLNLVAGGAGGAPTGGDYNVVGQTGGYGDGGESGSEEVGGGGGDSAFGLGHGAQITSGDQTRPGDDGTGYGGGGQGGCRHTSGSGTTGGDGTDGIIIVEEFY